MKGRFSQGGFSYQEAISRGVSAQDPADEAEGEGQKQLKFLYGVSGGFTLILIPMQIKPALPHGRFFSAAYSRPSAFQLKIITSSLS